MNMPLSYKKETAMIVIGLLLFAGSILWIILGTIPPKSAGLFEQIRENWPLGKELRIAVMIDPSVSSPQDTIYTQVEDTDRIIESLNSLESRVQQVCETKEPIYFLPQPCSLYFLGTDMGPIYIMGNLILYNANQTDRYPQTYVYILDKPISDEEIAWILGGSAAESAA